MTSKKLTLAAAAVAALAMIGCGGSSSNPTQSSTTVTPTAAATLTAGSATLTIPAGAVATNQTVTLKETQPLHGGKIRVEIEPKDLPLVHEAQLSITDDNGNAKMKMVDDNAVAHQMEIEDRNHHKFKTSLSKLEPVEMEEEHTACSPDCGAGFECDDSHGGTPACKADDANESRKTCTEVCPAGSECDDNGDAAGAKCKLHSEVETEHNNQGGPVTCPPCAAGTTCSTTDGACHT
jgi:uncharacterized cupredoxin-like copper-binding protein